MKTHLKYAIAGLALLTGLGLGNVVQAENNVPPPVVQLEKPAIVLLAWQRVGAPIRLEG